MNEQVTLYHREGGGEGPKGGMGGGGVRGIFFGGNHMVLGGNKGRISHNSQSAEPRSHDPKGK